MDAVPVEIHVASLVFWRLAYNAGLGVILHYQVCAPPCFFKALSLSIASRFIVVLVEFFFYQSNYRSLTKMYEYHTKKRTCLGAVLRYLAGAGHPSHDPDSVPACLNAWFAYRHLVDVILINDSFNFLFVCIKFLEPIPTEITYFVVFRYIVGLILMPINFWAKVRML
jgi:phosphatidylethanolamine N-methyltransferase